MSFSGFQRDISFAPSGVGGQAVARELAAFAREAVAQAIREGQATGQYIRTVNGRIGADESHVQTPGPIIYQFDWLRYAVDDALAAFRRLAPARSGRYRRSFFVTVNGQATSVDQIPIGASAVITNDQPYTRKIEVGSEGFEDYAGLFETVRKHIGREYRGLIRGKVLFIRLVGGYVLKGDGRPGKVRRDRAPGQPLTYPALVLDSALSEQTGGLA